MASAAIPRGQYRPGVLVLLRLDGLPKANPHPVIGSEQRCPGDKRDSGNYLGLQAPPGGTPHRHAVKKEIAVIFHNATS